MTLVWGIRQEGPEDRRKRAKWLFQQLELDKAQVIIPSVALSEYLIRVKPEEHGGVVAALSGRFLIQPFDAQCASLAAKLFLQGKELRKMSADGARKTLKADAFIIATAVVHGARKLYSGDADCRKLASKVRDLTVEDLPTVAPDLFADADDQ
jgi:predicted nucleic acid-binding protein